MVARKIKAINVEHFKCLCNIWFAHVDCSSAEYRVFNRIQIRFKAGVTGTNILFFFYSLTCGAQKPSVLSV